MEHHKENQIIDPDKDGGRRPMKLWQVGSIAIAILGFATIIGISYSRVQGNTSTDGLGGPDYAKLIEASDEPIKLTAAEYDAQQQGIEPPRQRPPVGTVVETTSTASTGIGRSTPDRVERITAEGLIEEVAPLDVREPEMRGSDVTTDDPMEAIERARAQIAAEQAAAGDLEQRLMATGEDAGIDMIDEAEADAEAMADLIASRVAEVEDARRETISEAVETRIAPPPPPIAALRDIPPAPVATPRAQPTRSAGIVPPPPATPDAPAASEPTPEPRSFAAITIEPPRKPPLRAAPSGDQPVATPAAVRATPPPPPPTVEAQRPVRVDGWRVQFAAVTSKGAAEAEFKRLARANPNTVGKLQMMIHQHSTDDGRTFYRVQGGGLSEAESRDMCEQLKASGVQCFVTRSR